MAKANIDLMEDGPALISVKPDDVGEEGSTFTVNGDTFDVPEGGVIALCRCGKTGKDNGTCDGSHAA